MKKIVPLLFILVGVALVVLGIYMKGQVQEGRGRLAQAQQGVDIAKDVLNTNEYTAPVSGLVTDPVQSKIDQNQAKASAYATLSSWCLGVGIALILLGFFYLAYLLFLT